jgi:hypothetical protein
MDIANNDSKKSIAKLYSVNQKVYDTAVKKIKDQRITEFPSQNALYLFIEKIKFPFLRNHSKIKPKYINKNIYSGKNYEPIINHLIENGVIKNNGLVNNRYTYSVVMVSPAEPSKMDSTTATENYFQNLNKIDMPAVAGDRVSSQPQPAQEPTSTQKVVINNASKNLEEILHLSENRIYIENAINSLMQCNLKDQFMRARIYNLTVLAQDISKAISDRQSLILGSAETEFNNIIK